MRILTLASLLIAVTAAHGHRGMECPSRFINGVIATSPRSNHLSETQQSELATARECCKRVLRRMMSVICRRVCLLKTRRRTALALTASRSSC